MASMCQRNRRTGRLLLRVRMSEGSSSLARDLKEVSQHKLQRASTLLRSLLIQNALHSIDLAADSADPRPAPAVRAALPRPRSSLVDARDADEGFPADALPPVASPSVDDADFEAQWAALGCGDDEDAECHTSPSACCAAVAAADELELDDGHEPDPNDSGVFCSSPTGLSVAPSARSALDDDDDDEEDDAFDDLFDYEALDAPVQSIAAICKSKGPPAARKRSREDEAEQNVLDACPWQGTPPSLIVKASRPAYACSPRLQRREMPAIALLDAPIR